MSVAAALTRLLAGLLYGTDPLDPFTFGVMAAALLCVGLAASWLPARRASAVDPMHTIRGE
jgi:ABC-type lipoprotein release transport system permease subunit